MTDHAPSMLTEWSTFFSVTAGAAATLTGLMFVVVTLIRREDWGDANPDDGISTFSTPTVINFGAALLVSAVMIAPWPSIAGPLICTGFLGLAGMIHILRVALRARRMTVYDPDVEDWIWYWILPFSAYCVVLAGALLMPFERTAPFVTGASVLLLMFIGIRNSWDVVTFIAKGGPRSGRQNPQG